MRDAAAIRSELEALVGALGVTVEQRLDVGFLLDDYATAIEAGLQAAIDDGLGCPKCSDLHGQVSDLEDTVATLRERVHQLETAAKSAGGG